MNVIIPSIGIRSLPSEDAPLETECLFGETITIIEEYSDWIYCELNTDKYRGWLKKFGLGYLKKPTHRIITPRSFIYPKKDIKVNSIQHVSLGSQLTVKKFEDDWACIYLSNSKKNDFGYLPKKHLIGINSKIKDWVSISEQLLDTPYKWGGRDTLGIDCSALLQLSYQTYGINLPRNTSQQIKLNKGLIKNISSLERGCVVFWEGHVAIMTDKKNCIHANAFHMKTNIEPLNNIVDRMSEKYKIIKMFNLN